VPTKTKNALQSFSALTDIVVSSQNVVVYWRHFDCFRYNYYNRSNYYNSNNNHSR